MNTNWQDKYLRPQFNSGGMASGSPQGGGMDWSRAAGIGGGAASLGAGLSQLFGGYDDPYKDASKYYNQIPDQMKQYYDPYINAGRGAMNQLQGQYGNLINDPNAMYNKLAGGFKESPGYQWQLGQGMNAAGNAAAAGGMAGTAQHQQQASTMAQGLANQDFGNYMNRVGGLYGQGLHGLEGINQMGYGASTDLGSSLANYLAMQGENAYAGTNARNKNQGDMWGNILGGGASLAASMYGM